ncbi:hypothetical protein [Microbacterium rhizomatis]|uniref:Uncharacterized protein n=1 Tax=Microbacterium rhizomatis TaxID=1631477 RepID=A0A5J5J0R0_9MICO|nr:hypothetical protein [Microbacterium rhizomatis]KAA9106072.1 hypothetical protein F6B43_17105 [Microbacterium rhizomatis]
MDLNEHIIAAVDRYWADDVHILGAWSDGPTSACVVYSRTIDPAWILGHRFEFNAASADGTIARAMLATSRSISPSRSAQLLKPAVRTSTAFFGWLFKGVNRRLSCRQTWWIEPPERG